MATDSQAFATNRPLIFDGHNDALSQLMRSGGVSAARGFVDGTELHVDLPKARAGGLGGGLFALWVPSPDAGVDYQALMAEPPYAIPLPEPVSQGQALATVHMQLAIAFELERLGALSLCRCVEDIEHCLATEQLAAVLHLEGAEAIDPDFASLEVLFHLGLRSLGPVWSRSTIFGEGVPFHFPGDPDIGGGLTDLGKALVGRCNELGILIDLSHMNEAGFNDVAELSSSPLVATHSNAHRLCKQPRNLTDRQLAAIRASDGLVGLNFATAFLAADGRMQPDIGLDDVLRHLDHLIEQLGEDGVAFGSDFDGAVVPAAIGNAAGLVTLRGAMRQHGFDEPLLTKLCQGNWLRVLRSSWTD